MHCFQLHESELLRALDAIPAKTAEVMLRKVRARIDLGDLDAAGTELNSVVPLVHPDDWRVPWHRGLIALAAGRTADAWTAFDAVYDAVPGELAPKLALAATAEHVDRAAAAARYYELVWRTDHAFVSAAFGLARVRMAAGERPSAVAVLESVPETSSQYIPAQVAAVRSRIGQGTPSEPELVAAADRLFFLHAAANSKTVAFAEELLSHGKDALTFDTRENENLKMMGATTWRDR